jgi:hypothetical protein
MYTSLLHEAIAWIWIFLVHLGLPFLLVPSDFIAKVSNELLSHWCYILRPFYPSRLKLFQLMIVSLQGLRHSEALKRHIIHILRILAMLKIMLHNRRLLIFSCESGNLLPFQVMIFRVCYFATISKSLMSRTRHLAEPNTLPQPTATVRRVTPASLMAQMYSIGSLRGI